MRDCKHYVWIGLFGVWKCFLLLGQLWPTPQKCRHGLHRGSRRTEALQGSGHSVDTAYLLGSGSGASRGVLEGSFGGGGNGRALRMPGARWRSILKVSACCTAVCNTPNMSYVSSCRAANCPGFLGTEMVQADRTLGHHPSQPGLDRPLLGCGCQVGSGGLRRVLLAAVLVGHSEGKRRTSTCPCGLPHATSSGPCLPANLQPVSINETFPCPFWWLFSNGRCCANCPSSWDIALCRFYPVPLPCHLGGALVHIPVQLLRRHGSP